MLANQVPRLDYAIPCSLTFSTLGAPNASQGSSAQVVLAGNLSYSSNKYLTVTSGIMSLPGTRSVEGNFPFWLAVDSRLIADEFFPPSYLHGRPGQRHSEERVDLSDNDSQ